MLSEAAGQVDEEGLLFLLRQANTLLRQECRRREPGARRAILEAGTRRVARGRPSDGGRPVSIDESDNRSAIFITLGSTRKVLNLQELKQLVRICYAAETKTDALRQLYPGPGQGEVRYPRGRRQIGNPANPLVEGLFHALRRKYRLDEP